MAGIAKWDKVQEDLLDAIGKIAKKHKVVFERNGYKYDDDICTFSIRATVTDTSGEKKDIDRETFIRYAKEPWAIIQPEWLDSSFVERGRNYTVVGYEPTRKYSVKTVRDDGKTYSWRDAFVKEKMSPKAETAAK